MKKIENYIFFFLLLIVTIVYFCVPILVTPDSVEYYEYLKIFDGTEPFSSWNVVRGPSLPIILYFGSLIFGNNALGFLATTYLFFLLTVFSLYYLLNQIFNLYKVSTWKKLVIKFFLVVFVLLNPILFGYSHALLTEFVGIPFAVISVILSWNWLRVDFFKTRRQYVLYTFIFAFLFVFLWFLKQPYFSLIFFPMLISSILSVFNNPNVKNVLQRAISFVFCIAVLLISMQLWKSALINSKIDYENGSNNSHFLSYGIIGGISNLRFDNEFDVAKPENLSDDNFISQEEKELIEKKLKNETSGGFNIVNVYSPSGVFLDRIVFAYEGEKFTAKDSISLFLNILTKYPKSLLESYYSNYLATINVYISSRSLSGIYYPIKTFTMTSHENYSIGLNYLGDVDNFKWIGEDNFQKVKPLYSFSMIDIEPSKYIDLYTSIYLAFFKILFLVLPTLTIFIVLQYLVKKYLQGKKHLHLENLGIIILSSALLHVLFHVFMGGIIDRYVFVVFPILLLGTLTTIFLNTPKRN